MNRICLLFQLNSHEKCNLSRQCKGCRTGESLRRQGAAQRGGLHSCGHSPIAGETLTNGAIEEASSPWADTGLAQGTRPLSQRTGSASSAAAYKDAPDAKSVFFSPAIHRVLLSRFSSRKKAQPTIPAFLPQGPSFVTSKFNFIDFSLPREVIPTIYYVLSCLSCQSIGH